MVDVNLVIELLALGTTCILLVHSLGNFGKSFGGLDFVFAISNFVFFGLGLLDSSESSSSFLCLTLNPLPLSSVSDAVRVRLLFCNLITFSNALSKVSVRHQQNKL